AKANAEHSLTRVAASLGAPVQTSPALSRRTSSGLFDANLVAAIFKAPPGGAVYATSANGSIVIARVSGIVHPAPPNDVSFIGGVRQLSGEIAGDITISLARDVQKRDGTQVNQALVDSTIGGNSGTGS